MFVKPPINQLNGLLGNLEQQIDGSEYVPNAVPIADFAAWAGCSAASLGIWRERGTLPAFPNPGRRNGWCVNPLEVRDFWRRLVLDPTLRVFEPTPKPQAEPLPVLTTEQTVALPAMPEQPPPLVADVAQPSVVVSRKPDPFPAIRERAIREAWVAYRDYVLAEAESAEARGDVSLQVRLLQDYVHTEEGFKVTFEKSGA